MPHTNFSANTDACMNALDPFTAHETEGVFHLGPVDQPKSLKQVAYENLHQAIFSRVLIQGEVYTERELATRLSISRTPVREALLELAAKDLVVLVPRKGIKVKTFERRDWQDIFELRQALEVAAVEKVAGVARAEDVAMMESIIEKQRDHELNGDGNAFLYQDRLLHGLICKLTRNERLIRHFKDLLDLIQLMGTYPLSEKGRMKEVIHEHIFIVESIRIHDPDLSREAMKKHLGVTRIKGLNTVDSWTRG